MAIRRTPKKKSGKSKGTKVAQSLYSRNPDYYKGVGGKKLFSWDNNNPVTKGSNSINAKGGAIPANNNYRLK